LFSGRGFAATHVAGHFSGSALAVIAVSATAARSAAVIQGDARCDICKEVSDEEDLRIREFVSCIDRDDVVRWLKGDAVLCISHGMRLRRQVPFVLTAHIDAILENCRQQLTYELQQLRSELEPHRLGWGALGRAAEFLVSQRGLRA
jgi:hypothetical protein